MYPAEFEQANTKLTGEGSVDLPVLVEMADNERTITSYWTMSQEEAAELLKIAERQKDGENVHIAIQLKVWGGIHPPVSLAVAKLE